MGLCSGGLLLANGAKLPIWCWHGNQHPCPHHQSLGQATVAAMPGLLGCGASCGSACSRDILMSQSSQCQGPHLLQSQMEMQPRSDFRRGNFLTMMPNFRMAVEERSYPMSNKVRADLKTILTNYMTFREGRKRGREREIDFRIHRTDETLKLFIFRSSCPLNH